MTKSDGYLSSFINDEFMNYTFHLCIVYFASVYNMYCIFFSAKADSPKKAVTPAKRATRGKPGKASAKKTPVKVTKLKQAKTADIAEEVASSQQASPAKRTRGKTASKVATPKKAAVGKVSVAAKKATTPKVEKATGKRKVVTPVKSAAKKQKTVKKAETPAKRVTRARR